MLEERKDGNNTNTSIATQEPLWIPTDFKHLTGDMDTGYVVIDPLGNEFTYLNGIWVSRYEISKGENGIPVSLPNKPTWTGEHYYDVKFRILEKFRKSDNCNYTVDLINDWTTEIVEPIATKIDRKLVYEDSSSIGAYINNGEEINTGSNPKFMVYNISDLAGNHWCLTNKKNLKVEVGGGSYLTEGNICTLAWRGVAGGFERANDVGFRIVLRKKES